MHNRYFEIFKIKVDNFINELARSKALYENLANTNKLLHAGEYGMYKERSLHQLIDFITPYGYQVTDGFIINSYNETSTQCDLIIFDKIKTPLIEFGNRFQFLPVESVAAIGEVKSTLSKKDFIEALVKLTSIKKLFRPSESFLKHNSGFSQENFAPFVFLICDSVTGINDDYTFNDLVKDAIKSYQENNVEKCDYHNIAVLIHQNKTLSYNMPLDFCKANNLKQEKTYQPIWQNHLMNHTVNDCQDHYNLLRELATGLSNSLKMRKLFYPDPVDYLW
ncbi:DUF6602 domain-containing protein [Pedobacter paludis]|uniref:DUF6602 domain-containing protein n=1 Tax=Pedobacter paludis TaxID=2203212 RepID=A0A317F563_9SPHI|nr:DUF6602 domain-containing protein [Pedobacter paludis]PWS32628.1 hypothetical protein DF947_06025 [Pedobacter paludis]